jgi:hypothetical protein
MIVYYNLNYTKKQMSSTLIEIIENIRPRRIRGANSKRNAIKSKRHLTKGCSESDEEYRN